MSANINLKVLLAAFTAVLIAMAFYVMHLRSELIEAERLSAAVRGEVAAQKVTIARIEDERTVAANERDAMQAQLSESKELLVKLSEGSEKKSGELNEEISVLRARIAHEAKVSAWWRELFDYTKTFNRQDESRLHATTMK
ncbi:MAG: hypothetical protein AB7I36_10285 [Rhodospirillaceae bacterium]